MVFVPQRVRKKKYEIIDKEKIYEEAVYYCEATEILENYRKEDVLFPPILMNVTFA